MDNFSQKVNSIRPERENKKAKSVRGKLFNYTIIDTHDLHATVVVFSSTHRTHPTHTLTQKHSLTHMMMTFLIRTFVHKLMSLGKFFTNNEMRMAEA
jgi:hypothetical protein